MKVVVEYVDGVTKRFDGVREYAVNGGILILHALVDVTPTLIPWMHVRFVTPANGAPGEKQSVGFKRSAVVMDEVVGAVESSGSQMAQMVRGNY